jgi:hypothetical protein
LSIIYDSKFVTFFTHLNLSAPFYSKRGNNFSLYPRERARVRGKDALLLLGQQTSVAFPANGKSSTN